MKIVWQKELILELENQLIEIEDDLVQGITYPNNTNYLAQAAAKVENFSPIWDQYQKLEEERKSEIGFSFFSYFDPVPVEGFLDKEYLEENIVYNFRFAVMKIIAINRTDGREKATEYLDKELRPLIDDIDSFLFLKLADRRLFIEREKKDFMIYRNRVLIFISVISALALLLNISFNIKTNRTLARMMVELQNVAEKLKIAAKEAEAANEAKSEFLANMSHELRTPLNSIIGVSELIKENRISEEFKSLMEIVDHSSANLLNIINDILDLSKIEAGEVDLEYRAFNLKDNVSRIVHDLTPIASKKGLLLSLENKIEGDFFALGDSHKLTRVLTNLINNAVRYTEKGTVTVIAQKDGGEAGQEFIKIEIVDTGIGIPKNRIEQIFYKFVQADVSTTRKYGGTGLGLTICRELIDLMDGEIGVESKEGVGSTFWIRIPFKTVTEEYSLETRKQELQKPDLQSDGIPISEARILLVEDNPMSILFMKKLFEQFDVTNYTCAENGIDALEEIKANEYDLVLTDCHMPVMNGYDLTKEVRALENKKKANVPIVAMTANVLQKDIDYFYEIGGNEYIGKPFTLAEFKEKLSYWIDFSGSATSGLEKQERQTDEDIRLDYKDLPLVDLENLKEIAQGDESFIKEMVSLFVSQGKPQIKNLKQECTDGENSEWIEGTHFLKGVAGGVGALSMRELCRQAQEMKTASSEERKIILDQIEELFYKTTDIFTKEGLY